MSWAVFPEGSWATIISWVMGKDSLLEKLNWTFPVLMLAGIPWYRNFWAKMS